MVRRIVWATKIWPKNFGPRKLIDQPYESLRHSIILSARQSAYRARQSSHQVGLYLLNSLTISSWG